MYSEDDLTAAVAAGVMPDTVATAFRDFVATRQAAPAVDEEHFRLVTGFNDIFVSIAGGMILTALVWLGMQVAPGVGGALLAASSWSLAEYFTRQRRMALPSILLLLAFVAGIGLIPIEIAGAGDWNIGYAAAIGSLIAAGAAWLHWRRFKVPITVAAGVAVLTAIVPALMMGFFKDDAEPWILPVLLVGGIAIFILALRWDASDRNRTTRRSDVAFWLHLLASPLIVHPLFAYVGVFSADAGRIAPALIALLIYGVLGVIALAVDRRALLISALVYVMYGVSAIIEAVGSLNATLAVTALIIGSALLLLSALWHRVRAFVLRRLPQAWQARLPPITA